MKNRTEITNFLFKYRSYTPLPFVAVMLLYHQANVWSLIAGFIVLICGEAIRLWGVSWAGSETRTTGRVGGTFLIISGPFAYVRNPLYVGNILIYTGAGIMSFAAFPYLQIVGLLFFSFQYYLIVLEEERYLQQTFGEQFKNYVKNVPRFIPRLTPYKDAAVVQPPMDLKDGLKSERRTFQAISIVILTIVLIWFFRRLS